MTYFVYFILWYQLFKALIKSFAHIGFNEFGYGIAFFLDAVVWFVIIRYVQELVNKTSCGL